MVARPAARPLCEKTGFDEVARHEEDVRKYGGTGIDVSTCMLRGLRGLST